MPSSGTIRCAIEAPYPCPPPATGSFSPIVFSQEIFIFARRPGYLTFVVSSPWRFTIDLVEERDAVTLLSDRRPVLVDSTRTGLAQGRAPHPLALANGPDARRPQVAASLPQCVRRPVCRPGSRLERAREDATPWDAACWCRWPNGRCLRDQLSCSLRGVRRPPKTGRQASVSEQRPSGGDYAVGLGQDRPLQSGLISDEGVGRAKSGNRRVEV